MMDGELRCTGCSRTYLVHRGVPRFVAQELSPSERLTAAVFGDEWRRAAFFEPYYRAQLEAWLKPLGLHAVQGQRVLDAGCGKGRHIRVLAESGASVVIGADFSEAVEVAFEHTKHLANAHIVQADLCRLPFGSDRFDIVISIGVLHHLPHPEDGVEALARHLVGGGKLAIWVYGAERTRWVQWVRRGSSILRSPHVPASALWALAVVPATVLFLWLRGVVSPLARRSLRWAHLLPSHEYLIAICRFPWRELRIIVYDQLAAPIAHYVSREEVERWLQRIGLRNIQLESVHGNSWAGFGIR